MVVQDDLALVDERSVFMSHSHLTNGWNRLIVLAAWVQKRLESINFLSICIETGWHSFTWDSCRAAIVFVAVNFDHLSWWWLGWLGLGSCYISELWSLRNPTSDDLAPACVLHNRLQFQLSCLWIDSLVQCIGTSHLYSLMTVGPVELVRQELLLRILMMLLGLLELLKGLDTLHLLMICVVCGKDRCVVWSRWMGYHQLAGRVMGLGVFRQGLEGLSASSSTQFGFIVLVAHGSHVWLMQCESTCDLLLLMLGQELTGLSLS